MGLNMTYDHMLSQMSSQNVAEFFSHSVGPLDATEILIPLAGWWFQIYYINLYYIFMIFNSIREDDRLTMLGDWYWLLLPDSSIFKISPVDVPNVSWELCL